MRRLAGEENAVAHRFGERGSRPLPARGSRRERTQRPRFPVPSRGARPFDGLAYVCAVEAGEPVERKRDHRWLASSRKLGAELSAHFYGAQRSAGNVRQNGGSTGRVGFFENKFVALQPERVAGQFQRDV